MSSKRYMGWGLLTALTSACVSCGPRLGALGPRNDCVATEARLAPDRIDAILRPNIVQVRTDDGSGSGFILGAGDDNDVLVVTNYHVIAGGETFSVIFVRPDGKRVQVSGVEVVKTDPDNDLALLKAPRMSVFGRGLSLAGPPKTGQSVGTLGYPVLDDQDAEPQLTNGFVSSVDRKFGSRHFVLTDMQLIPGNSGGAAVDSCGNVVGVASAHHAEAKHIGALVAAEKVRQLHSRYLAARAPTETEIQERLRDFVLSLQRDDGRHAASFFSRSFYSEWVFPQFREVAQQAIEQRKRFVELEGFLNTQGTSIAELNEQQLKVFMEHMGITFSASQVYALKVIEMAKEHDWDSYTMLRQYFSPFVGASFGAVHRFRVEEVREQDRVQLTHVILTSARGGETHVQVDMIYEWGDWHIAGYRVTNDAGEAAGDDDSAVSEASRPGDWFKVKSR